MITRNPGRGRSFGGWLVERCIGVLIAGCGLLGTSLGAQGGTPTQTQVPAADLAALKLADFADDELDLPYYVVNFARVANSVPLDGELRGWVTVSVWRGDNNQRTYNARVLETQLSLAYFYCTKRPWNPYYAHSAVRARLEAMLERWCQMQGPNGEFSEYGAGRWSLAPTAFATKFMGETLRLLVKGPPIDAGLHERVKRAQRRAILVTLTDADLWAHGCQFANQFSNVWGGALAWLALFPGDEEVRRQLLKRMNQAATGLQSPAGYFYERDGPDWGYSLSTHHSNLEVAWHYARGTEFESLVREEVRRFYDWLSWNAVREPDGSGYVLNRAIETRQRRPWIALADDPQTRNFSSVPQAEVVELARAFVPSREQQEAARKRSRAELEATWPSLPRLREGDFRAFTPYAFLHRSLTQWLPKAKQQIAAQADLPCERASRAAHLRADNRHGIYFLYVRRPAYYAAFNGGKRLNDGQRFGLGLLWAQGVGALAQSQTGSNADVWGTRSRSEETPYEAASLNAAIVLGGKELEPEPGARDLGEGELTVAYPLGTEGRKTLRFEDDRIRIQTDHPGAFSETVPLLTRAGDKVRVEAGRVMLERGGKPVLAIEFGGTAAAEVSEAHGKVGPYEVTTVRLKAQNSLGYSVIVRR